MMQEKEITTVVNCVRSWTHYLLGPMFMVKTVNMVTRYFQSQKNITLKQARWKDFMVEFDYVLEYQAEGGNVVADALTRKAKIASITTAHCDIKDAVKDGMQMIDRPRC